MGLVPVELDLKGLSRDQGRKRKKCKSNKLIPSHVLSRRRAQNRASQQALRNRKRKQTKELEETLTEFQRLYNDLTQSYETLMFEYSTIKQGLEMLRRENTKHKSMPPTPKNYASGIRKWDGPRVVASDPLLFNGSTFYYGEDGSLEAERAHWLNRIS